MDLRNLFKDRGAVSPVIGVAFMVAITVILAATVVSSVFGKEAPESAPQANINIIVVDSYIASDNGVLEKIAKVKIEHLGGSGRF